MAGPPKPIRVEPFRARVLRARGQRGARWYWRGERHVDGRDVTVWTGWATRDEAIAQLRGLDMATGEPAPPAQADTLRDLLELWIGDCAERVEAGQLAQSSLTNYRFRCKVLVRLVGDVRLERVDARQLQDLSRAIGRTHSPYYQRGILDALSAAWRWGRQIGLHDLAEVRRPRSVRAEGVRERVTPTEGEVRQLLAYADQHAPRWQHDLLAVIAGTGMRLAEAADLTADDWSPATGMLQVEGKTGVRRIPVAHDDLREILERLVADARERGQPSLWVVSRRSIIYSQGITRRLCVAAGIRSTTAHGLRRHAVDRLLVAGVDPGVVGRILGHSPAVALRHYRMPTDTDLHDSMAAAGLGRLSAPEGEVLALRPRRRG